MNLFKYILALLLIAAALPFGCKTAKLSTAEEKQRIGEYFEAAAIYRKIYAKTPPKDREMRGYIAFRMGECNRLINNTARAASDYANALRYHYPDTSIYLRLAQTSHKRGLYAEAIKYFNEYLKINPGYIPAINGLKGAEMAAQWKNTPSRYIVKRMEKFNSRYSEFSPMLYGEKSDQIYFASSRKKAKDAKPSGITGLANNNFYHAKQDDKGVWLAPTEVEDPINTDFDEGVASFTADGGTMYYTYCAKADDGPRTAEIYAATRASAAWGAGSRVGIVKDSITTLAHPAVSPDGQYLYFVSDASGGFGGKDIYRARRNGSDFGPMENLGPQINTPADEMFPYVRDSVTLYFASDGHPGMGGLDLFKATLDSAGIWHVSNLKPPINSMADDFGITFAHQNESGYFSSNRGDLRGSDHIYSFELPQLKINIEGIVFDIDEHPLEAATIRIVGQDGLNEKAAVRPDGTYRVELARNVSYVMMASAPGFLNQNFELRTIAEEKSETYIVDFFLSPLNRPVLVENIFYGFNQATLRPESKEALDLMIKILNENPHVKLEFGSHTDRVGSVAYNEALAQRRAQSVVDYLIASGIPSERLQAKGYGKNQPKIVDKKLAELHTFLQEGDQLTEDYVNNLPPEQQAIADQINRRTEFKALELNSSPDL
jgi:peptidoglycan-associated lipoprotein